MSQIKNSLKNVYLLVCKKAWSFQPKSEIYKRFNQNI